MKRFHTLLILVVSIVIFLHSIRFTYPTIPTKVINLDRSPGRLFITKLQAFLYGIPIERHAAIDGNTYKFSDEFTNKYFSGKSWEDIKKKKKPEQLKRIMACATSHFTIWQEYYKNQSPYVCILEDDLILEPQHRQTVNEVIRGLNKYDPDWHVIWLSGWITRKTVDDQPAFNVSGHTIYHFKDHGGGCGAYIMSRKGLEHYVSILESQGCSHASDGFLWEHLDARHAYNIRWPICHFTEVITSTIGNTNSN